MLKFTLDTADISEYGKIAAFLTESLAGHQFRQANNTKPVNGEPMRL